VKNLVEMDAGVLYLGAPGGQFKAGASATGENRPYPVKISSIGDGRWTCVISHFFPPVFLL